MTETKTPRLSRRTLLQGAGAAAGLAAGSGIITGFPAIIAAEPVTLRYLGTAVNQSGDIARKVKEDLGITIEYIPVVTDEVSKRVVTQPNSFDIVDSEYFSLKKLMPSGNLVGMDARRIKNADKITPVFTKGEVGGKKIGDQGTAPKKVFYLEGQNSTKFAASPTEWITLIPTTYNADTLGIRPDLIKRADHLVEGIAEPRIQGQGLDPQHPVDRHHGRRDGGGGDRRLHLSRQGQHDEGRDRPHHEGADRGQACRAVPRLLAGFQRIREPDGVGRDGDPVDVVARRHQGALQGVACTYQPLKEGYRAWATGFGLPKTLTGKKLDAAYDFINWFLSGWAGAYLNRQGYYSAVLETAKANMEPYEWAFWMEGKPAEKDIKAPDGTIMEKAGAVRDGGSFEQRMGAVACWNSVMDENTYMVRKWNEFIAA